MWNESERNFIVRPERELSAGGTTKRWCLIYYLYYTSLFPRRCPGNYVSQSYSHMCTKFG
jgi:hypothetical protein